MSKLAIVKNKLSAGYTESNYIMQDFDVHFHNVYELYYFIDGDVDYLVEGKQYHLEPNSILLLSPYVLHGIRTNSDKTYTRFVIHFHPDAISLERRSLLLEAFPDKSKANSNEVYYTNMQEFSLRPFCELLIHSLNQDTFSVQKLAPIYLEALLAQLSSMYHNLYPSFESYTLSETVASITSYINAHLCEKLTLDTLSNHFFISKNHLNRLFRKAIGTTVFDYIIYKRIGYAEQLLESGMPATEVALQVGFGDYSSFYRAYKKIVGRSPCR